MNVQATVPLLDVDSMERSCAFYCEQLGFAIDSRWEPDGKLAWCWLRLGGASVMLQQAEGIGGAPEVRDIHLYFLCEDVDAVFDRCREVGVPVDPPSTSTFGMKQLFVRDPDGRTLCFEARVAS